LIAESADIKELFLIIIGITLNRLISSPIQIVGQDEAETVIIVPTIIIIIKEYR
jgi:hypothetical protein